MNEQSVPAKATVTTPGDREVRMERIFDAPREKVFAAYTAPGLISQWWGPQGTTTIVDEMEAVSGGRWRFVIRNSDGTEIGFRGTYREVTPPERIVQTFEWEGLPGHVCLETATFESLGEQTRIVATSLFHHSEERDGMIESGMERGLNESYARLDALLAAAAD